MANRAERVLESIKNVCGNDIYDTIIAEFGKISEKPSPIKQARYIKCTLDEICETQGIDIAKKVMRPCGYCCISDKTIKTAKQLYKESNKDIPVFLELLNHQYIGGGSLYLKYDKIFGIYKKCYCGIPESVEDLQETYCECSAGWFEKLFSSVFEKSVEVKRIQTILSGNDQCLFEISF